MFFMTPILFTLVLLGVLLTIFNVDLRNRLLEFGNQVPLLSSVLPEPPSAAGGELDETAIRTQNTETAVAELEAQLREKEAEVSTLAAEVAEKEQAIADLQSRVEQLQEDGEQQRLDDEQYQSRIAELAAMFGQLTPSRAAPILQSMTNEEMVLIMDAMRPEVRVAVMEKMDPRRAAEATVMLKDSLPAKDMQIAALQARLNEQQSSSASNADPFLDDARLGATFNNMAPGSAAELLMQMADVNPAKVLQILKAVNDTARANILAEMGELNKKYTAQIASKLMAGG